MIGFFDPPVWVYVVYTLVVTHITIMGVTLYLHRCQSHRALELHPVVSHFFRFWLWLTTGMETRQWVAIHRKHHAKVETEEDPHSPVAHGIRKVFWQGTELYRAAGRDAELVERYGHGTPDDWMERNVYGPHTSKGYVIMMLTNIALFGPIGLTIWAVQMLWIPILAAGVINGIGHWFGYRSFQTPDTSRNIVPLGILIGGEEMHNNHHGFASSAKFSVHWYEFDIGWLYIRVLSALGLAKAKKVAPTPMLRPEATAPDLDTVSAIIAHRFSVMAAYTRTVMSKVHAEELENKIDGYQQSVLRSVKGLLSQEERLLSEEARERLDRALDANHTLATAYRYKQRLQAIWEERTATQEGLLKALEQWCAEAEASGIRALQEFARMLPRYATVPA